MLLSEIGDKEIIDLTKGSRHGALGDAEILFNDDGFIKVSGINNNPDDLAISNGSGKSSLWCGIIWTLTGETIRGAKNIVNIFRDDGCFCDLIIL